MCSAHAKAGIYILKYLPRFVADIKSKICKWQCFIWPLFLKGHAFILCFMKGGFISALFSTLVTKGTYI